MNKIRSLFYLMVVLSLTSCKDYLQIFTVDSPDMNLYENDYFVSENEHLDFVYDFWSEGGIPIIEVRNNLADTILLDFKKSWFVQKSDRFAFAEKRSQDSISTYPPEVGFNVMYGEMPGSLFLPPDSTFKFESMMWNLAMSEDVDEDNLSQRYLYSNSPIQLEHHFVYHYPGQDSTLTDTIPHRLYVSQVDMYEYGEYRQFIQSNILSNKFFVTDASYYIMGFEERSSLSATLLSLFLGTE